MVAKVIPPDWLIVRVEKIPRSKRYLVDDVGLELGAVSVLMFPKKDDEIFFEEAGLAICDVFVFWFSFLRSSSCFCRSLIFS